MAADEFQAVNNLAENRECGALPAAGNFDSAADMAIGRRIAADSDLDVKNKK